MSRLNRRRKQAAARGVHVIRWPNGGPWDVFVETETLLGPRGVTRTKREAVNFAYCIAQHGRGPALIASA
ncbi:MAG: hypothetical protein GAK28_04407 [Luteibacter sp.]|uniref:hypothetical protein n=1 Tax=Luteibacter sp. TaxID=1886636 RepID=UPI00137EB4CB|nr:hypothetical protein [Luteibacter sp.]KAF1003944.1 MAG: hypothetical protein GAK28_04407 [Luteibacter sp.]